MDIDRTVRACHGVMVTAWSALADLVLPAVCPCCGITPGSALCAGCTARMPALVHACPRCGYPAQEDLLCPQCAGQGLTHLRSARCGWLYGGAIRELVLRAKDDSGSAAARCLAGLMPLADDQVDLVVPVPPARRPRPGPHLATMLARAVADRLGCPCHQRLAQTRQARPQRRLSMPDRRRNVHELFRCRGDVTGLRIVLVDDILTSGATASQAAGVLRQAGARWVDGVFLCRTP